MPLTLGPAGEVVEYGVDLGITHAAEIGDAQPQARQRIGHDRPVASELALLDDQLEIARLTGRGADLLGQHRDRPDRVVTVGAVALVDHGDDRVDEAVEPDDGPDGGQAVEAGVSFSAVALQICGRDRFIRVLSFPSGWGMRRRATPS